MMKATKTWVLIVLLLIPAINVHAWPIPDTGQTKCYNNAIEIPCPAPGQPFYGQDGNYTINPPSYTKLDATGAALPDNAATWAMVKDNVTGLIWENKTDDGGIHDKDNTYTWCDYNSETNGGNPGTCGPLVENVVTDTRAFIRTLNRDYFGGFSDWRMPTVKELQSIVDYGRWNPAINTTFFPGTVGSYNWSSTTYTGFTSNAWRVSFYYGDISNASKSYSHHVRAVRGGQAASLDRFVDNGDGTVTDTATGLMWQQGHSSSVLVWSEALTYAEDLPLAGYTDWRVPIVKELQSIVDYNRWNPAIDTTFFTPVGNYLSSTTDAGDTSGAWRVYLYDGYVDGGYKSNSDYVRAVRGGQSRLSGHLTITVPNQGDHWKIGEYKNITWDTAGIAGSVKISLSRQGGKVGTFETIIGSTENDGSFNWTTVTGPISVNCVLKIEPLNDPSKGTSQGFFTISGGTVVINPEPNSINAPWTLNGPIFSQLRTGDQALTGLASPVLTGTGDQTLTSLAPAGYTLTWGNVSGWIKPSPASSTQTLANGGTVTFTGTYTPTDSKIQVTPVSLDFGYVLMGSTQDLFLTVKNMGSGILIGNATTVAPFSVISGGSYSLDANQSQVVTIRYQPTSPGGNTDVVVLTGGGDATVPVIGENGCSGGVVVLQNMTFTSGYTYDCIGTTSITAGTGVTVQSGATVNFRAPIIKLQPGFRIEIGAVFSAKQ
jgi:hypothetical protein